MSRFSCMGAFNQRPNLLSGPVLPQRLLVNIQRLRQVTARSSQSDAALQNPQTAALLPARRGRKKAAGGNTGEFLVQSSAEPTAAPAEALGAAVAATAGVDAGDGAPGPQRFRLPSKLLDTLSDASVAALQQPAAAGSESLVAERLQGVDVLLLGKMKDADGQALTQGTMKAKLRAAGANPKNPEDKRRSGSYSSRMGLERPKLVVVGAGATKAGLEAATKGQGVVVLDVADFWRIFTAPEVNVEDLKKQFARVLQSTTELSHYAATCLQGSYPEPMPWLPKLVSELVNADIVKSPPDLYEKVDLGQLEGYGPDAQAAWDAAVEASRSMPLSRLLRGLGVAVSPVQVELLGRHYRTLEELDGERLEEVEARTMGAVSPSAYDSLRVWLDSKKNRGLLERLWRAGVQCVGEGFGSGAASMAEEEEEDEDEDEEEEEEEEEEVVVAAEEQVDTKLLVARQNAGLPLSLRSRGVCITGKLQTMTRSQMQAYLTRQGAYVRSSITRDTELLIVGKQAGSKEQEAIKRNIKVLQEAEFWKFYPRSP